MGSRWMDGRERDAAYEYALSVCVCAARAARLIERRDGRGGRSIKKVALTHCSTLCTKVHSSRHDEASAAPGPPGHRGHRTKLQPTVSGRRQTLFLLSLTQCICMPVTFFQTFFDATLVPERLKAKQLSLPRRSCTSA
jgi:hypothetical protein